MCLLCFLRANLHFQCDRFPEAIADYTRGKRHYDEQREAEIVRKEEQSYLVSVPLSALQERPDDAQTLRWRAVAYVQLEQWTEAFRDFDQSISIAPDGNRTICSLFLCLCAYVSHMCLLAFVVSLYV